MKDFASCYNEHAVKVSDSSCWGGGGGGGGGAPVRDPSSRSAVTCLYRTKLSTQKKEVLIRVTWSKTLLGHALSVDVGEYPPRHHRPKKGSAPNPMLLWKKKGTRTYQAGDTEVSLHWDTSCAKYAAGPEPVEGFYLVVVVKGEVGVVLGDMGREGVERLEGGAELPTAESSLVGRREQVTGSSSNLYSTKARFGDGGRDHEILIRCSGEGSEPELCVCIDRKKVVQVRRLQWNFRGNQTIFVDGLPVDMMWDVHDWWFCDAPAGRPAAFMFRTRSALESRLWLEEELLHRDQAGKSAFSLLIHAFKTP